MNIAIVAIVAFIIGAVTGYLTRARIASAEAKVQAEAQKVQTAVQDLKK